MGININSINRHKYTIKILYFTILNRYKKRLEHIYTTLLNNTNIFTFVNYKMKSKIIIFIFQFIRMQTSYTTKYFKLVMLNVPK